MFNVTPDTVAQKRTIRPLYAQTQATPYGGFLDPAWDRTVDIYPGMVMTKLAGEVFTLQKTGTQQPFGLAALFVAPTLGIDEVRATGTNLFTVWTGAIDAVFEILSPAFDTTADWTLPTDGTRKMIFSTLTAHAQGPGKLTTGVAADRDTTPIAELLDVVGTTKIVIRLNVLPGN